MRNQLAEDVLNNEMLYLMRCYQASLKSGAILNSAIKLLEQTSTLIDIFRDKRPITSMADARLSKLKQVGNFFKRWEEQVKIANISQAEKRNRLPTSECLEDMQALVLGFLQICKIHLERHPGWGITPSRFNSDIIENHFCQVRGIHNGNSTNPTLKSYSDTVNSVILGQTLKSRGRKSNAGIQAIQPYNFYLPRPAKRAKKDRTV
jgi:hypothetical protein